MHMRVNRSPLPSIEGRVLEYKQFIIIVTGAAMGVQYRAESTCSGFTRVTILSRLQDLIIVQVQTRHEARLLVALSSPPIFHGTLLDHAY